MNKNNLYGDYHTHTRYSHGIGTVEKNVLRAREICLKQIAITDHSLNHVMFGLTEKKIVRQQKDIEDAREKYKDIDILFGVEANLISGNGKIDINCEQAKLFDIILCGFHKPALPDSKADLTEIYINAIFSKMFKPSESAKKRNTIALIKAVEKNKIDVLSHINYSLKVNCGEVAKACSDNNTYLELSSRHICTDDRDIEQMLNTNVKFILNSDAHKPSNIGNCQSAWQLIEKWNIPEERIVNLAKKPVFRSQTN